MKKIKTILVDDEEGVLNTIRGMIYKFCPNIHIIAEASTPAEAIAQIKLHKPELVLMDIEMPPFGTSFDILKQIGEPDFGVIFITAYPQYAVEAINAIQPWAYLVKPFSIVKLQAALFIAEQKIAAANPDPSSLKQAEMFVGETGRGNIIVQIADIILCQSDGATVEILVARQHDTEILRSPKTLKELEEELPEQIFFRTHHSFIVNIRAVERWERTGRNGLVLLKNGMRVPVSVQKLVKFEARMKDL